MTNFLRSSAPEGVCCLAALVLLAGCGCSSDPAATDDPVAAAEAASAAFSSGDYATALAHCRRSLELAPGTVEVLVMQGQAALNCGDEQTITEAIDAAVQARPDDVAVIQLVAQAALAKSEWDTAFKNYTKLAFDESLPADVQSIGWTGRGIVGLARLRAGSAPDECQDVARTDFLRAVQLDRRNAVARYHLGLLYRDVFHFNQAALEQFEFYAGLMRNADDPHVAKAQEQIAALKKKIEDDRARGLSSRLRNAEACAEALRKADALNQKGQFKNAATHYAEALKQDPRSFDAAERLAQCYARSDNTKAGMERAYKAYCQAAALRTNTKVLIAAADLAVKLKNYQSAVTLYSRAVAAKPNDITAIDGLIRSLQNCGKRKAAATYQSYRNSLPKRT